MGLDPLLPPAVDLDVGVASGGLEDRPALDRMLDELALQCRQPLRHLFSHHQLPSRHVARRPYRRPQPVASRTPAALTASFAPHRIDEPREADEDGHGRDVVARPGIGLVTDWSQDLREGPQPGGTAAHLGSAFPLVRGGCAGWGRIARHPVRATGIRVGSHIPRGFESPTLRSRSSI